VKSVDAEMSYEDLGGTVQQLIGPQRPDQVVPLLVNHLVRHKDPEKAAQLADAWALASLKTVQTSLFANLQPIREATSAALEPLQVRLEEARVALEAFNAKDNSDALQATLDRLSQLIADAKTGVVFQSQLSLSQSSESTDLISNSLSNPNIFSSEFNLGSSLNLEQEIATTEAIVDSLQAQGQTSVQQQAHLAGLTQRREVLAAQLSSFETEYTKTQQALARLLKERNILELEQSNAEEAYQSIKVLQPMIEYVTTINPANARLLNQASVPSDSVSPRRLLNTALATVLAGLLTLLFVFLREAIRAPIERKST
jgi:capsular polysaccharide biosynthesis protein